MLRPGQERCPFDKAFLGHVMKILHIVGGNLSGGASRGAYWLHLALKRSGIESVVLTNSKTTLGDRDVISISQTKAARIICAARAQLDAVLTAPYQRQRGIPFSAGCFGFDFTKTQEYRQADIIHLHWVCNGLINIKHLFKIDKPIIWTMRDMWPFTGGCHYSMGCENYKIGCGRCPQLKSRRWNDLSRFILNRKVRYLPKNMKMIGISNWLSSCARSSLLLKNFDVRTIYNNIDLQEFFPVDKQTARTSLNIDTEKKIILIVAHNIAAFYKGFEKFIEATKKLQKSEYCLIFCGHVDRNLIDNLGFEYRSFGYLYDNISLRLVYSAADVFVAPSTMDAFGKTLAESMACGTPVVCFDATGPREIVSHKVNGYRAKLSDPVDLADGITWVLNNLSHGHLSRNAIESVSRNFDSDCIAKQYIKLYEEILHQ